MKSNGITFESEKRFGKSRRFDAEKKTKDKDAESKQ